MRTGLFHRCSVSVAALALLAGATPSLAAPDWDIVGIRLGMSPAQARAAIAAHATKARITDYTRQFVYSDGVKEKQLPGFLSSITADHNGYTGNGEMLEVMFSTPPMEQRVIRVIRTLKMNDDPLPMERAMDSVTQKYGKPHKVLEANLRNGNFSRWVEPGKMVCGDTAPTSMEARQAPPVDNSPDGVSQYGVWQKRKQAPADASNCSAALVVNLVTRPGDAFVREMRFTMTDPGYAIPAMRAAAKQIADLQAQARKARQNSGAVPKL